MRNKILELLKELKIKKIQMARELDVTPQHINGIIRGASNGSNKFWRNFQKVYNIADDEIEIYKRKDN